MIGVINTWSDINFCHTHLRARAEDVKRGILQAGGFPVELPAMSLSEPFVKPSTMLYRNLLAMETRGIVAQPSDRRRGADGRLRQDHARADHGRHQHGNSGDLRARRPAARGNWRGQVLGSGSDAWKYWDEKRAGRISDEDWAEIEGGIARSFGTCMVMGTAATMMAIAEALGLTLPGASSIPAADSSHPRMCAQAGRRIVDMVWEDLTPQQHSHPRGLRQRHPRAHGHGRLDQRHHPRGGDGAPRRFADGYGRASIGSRARYRCSPISARPARC